MAKRVLVLSYWGLEDGLTQGAVLPHVQALDEISSVQKILLVTLEREHHVVGERQLPGKVEHKPVYIKNYGPNILSKAADFLVLPARLKTIAEKKEINSVVGFGALAGALAHFIFTRSGIPYYVSLFEPHAAYMLESGVWGKHNLKYIFQKMWEEREKKYATGLMPVSEKYRQELLRERVPKGKIKLVPCVVDLQQFMMRESSRESMRRALSIEKDECVGIYVGKYGDLYYKEEVFQIYRQCFKTVPRFRLLILSPQPQEEIIHYLEESNIDKDRVYITTVPHTEVPQYMSAADFAFATFKPGPSKRCLSPIKIGEYWANGLPVLLTEGVGDDSDIIKNEGGGALFNLQEVGSVERAVQQILHILQDPNHRQEIPKLARKYRNPDRVKEAYEYFFGQKQEGHQ
ncbi:glycosyltransferase involved in cell wall biosynthesis [Pontibacter ummariensis]|uniref:Glycosyltransferase involved in cell wall bisynthesis n=1 Tax=Pontibacter ummariensis TaxID=1610492 RepID=A0A239GAR3_9BACT|nr:glycosyltransferase [Pontibacter ummariensis]PRY11559.1 glycosyltransferase involved in cell wall biosynthesis [Pontibacter ummariensis]SNS66209.1 Glycosyltransferase involved in cell wall bisynthesis [Pontibacter ummariensis]